MRQEKPEQGPAPLDGTIGPFHERHLMHLQSLVDLKQ
jgi:hypothetical protein